VGVKELLRLGGYNPGHQTALKRILRDMLRAGEVTKEGKRFQIPRARGGGAPRVEEGRAGWSETGRPPRSAVAAPRRERHKGREKAAAAPRGRGRPGRGERLEQAAPARAGGRREERWERPGIRSRGPARAGARRERAGPGSERGERFARREWELE